MHQATRLHLDNMFIHSHPVTWDGNEESASNCPLHEIHVSNNSFIPLIRAGEFSDIISNFFVFRDKCLLWSGINAGIYEIIRPESRIDDSFSIQILSVKLWELKFQECINVSVSPHRWVPPPTHRVEQAAATLMIKENKAFRTFFPSSLHYESWMTSISAPS